MKDRLFEVLTEHETTLCSHRKNKHGQAKNWLLAITEKSRFLSSLPSRSESIEPQKKRTQQNMLPSPCCHSDIVSTKKRRGTKILFVVMIAKHSTAHVWHIVPNNQTGLMNGCVWRNKDIFENVCNQQACKWWKLPAYSRKCQRWIHIMSFFPHLGTPPYYRPFLRFFKERWTYISAKEVKFSPFSIWSCCLFSAFVKINWTAA